MEDAVAHLDNKIMQKYNVKFYDSSWSTFEIIKDFLEENKSERPFYIIDLGEVLQSFNNWQKLMPNVKPFYAMKCNPNLVLCESLASLGANFDCASENEIKQIIELTEDPSRIIFANPCKVTSQIRYARANDVDMMTFDSEEELYKVRLYHPYAKLLLRMAVDDSQSDCAFNKKFGCKLAQVDGLLKIAKALSLHVVGFCFHVGSGCHSGKAFYEALQDVKQACEMAFLMGFDINVIDIGGGFPGNDPAMFESIAQNVNKAIEDLFADEKYQNVVFMAEPGRFFAMKTHVLVVNVIGKKFYLKENGQKHFIYYLNDGLYGSFNCIYFDHAKPKLVPLTEKNGEVFPSTVFGPTCDSMDTIYDDIALPELAVGDWLYVEDFGAYTVAAASSFNGFETKVKKYILRNKIV